MSRPALAALAVWLMVGVSPPLARAVVDVGIIVNPYNGDRAGPETDTDAQAMLEGGLRETITRAGGRVASEHTVRLTVEEEREYGRWHRFGLASAHLADAAADNATEGLLNLGLYNNCSSLMGMLGGLRHSGEARLRVGLVWVDAHGDYNTPETTLSGMLGGMPVAIAAGDALQRMRTQARLDEPIHKADIVMVGVRDTDPLEQARIEQDDIAQLSVDDVRTLGERFHNAMTRLTERTDVVYVHVDLDVLDPEVIPGHPLTVPGGPTGEELGAAVEAMFRYPKTRALGLASYPHRDDPEKVTLEAIRILVAGAVSGAASRSGGSAGARPHAQPETSATSPRH